jgi:hypothetical protein
MNPEGSARDARALVVLIACAALSACVGRPFIESGPDGGSTGSMTASTSAAGGSQGGSDGGSGGEGASTAHEGGGGSGGVGGSGGAGGQPAKESPILVVDQDKHAASGVALVVNDAAGGLIAVSASDLSGNAKLAIPEGGSVSAYWSAADGEKRVTTFVGPPPGAAITFGVERPKVPLPPPPPSEFHVVVGLPQGATSFTCMNACGSSEGTKVGQTCTLTNSGCPPAPSMDILVVAYDGDAPVSWGAALAIAVNPGVVGVNVSATQVIAPMSSTITAIPAWATTAGVSARAFLSSDLWFSRSASASPPGPQLSALLAIPAGLGGGFEITEAFGVSSPSAITFVSRVRRFANLPAQTTFGAGALAKVTALPLDLSTPGRPMMSFSVSEGPLGDASRLELGFEDGATSGRHVVYLPNEHPRMFRLPEAPPALAAHLPGASSVLTHVGAALLDDESSEGYAPLLTRLFGETMAEDGQGVVESFEIRWSPAP